MEETALVVEEDDLQGLKLLRELTGSDVRVDVQDLASVGLGQASQNREGAGADGGFDGTLVDLGDLADEAVLVLVEVVGGEDARSDGAGAGAELLEGCDELEVLVEENAAGDLECLGI